MTYEEVGIEIPFGKSTGQVYTICPNCSKDRKKKKDKCLGVNLDKGVWHCMHCEFKGSIHKKTYVLPKWENKTTIQDSVVEWFSQRNIGQSVLAEMMVTDGGAWMPQVNKSVGCICFNYFREGKLINVKYRDRDKNFRLHKDAELIFYNFDGINRQKEIFITEGECDALVMIQAGFKNTCSVPNGATKGSNNLEYLNNCFDAFIEAEKVYIMTDSDAPGNQLADELGRRIGIERCLRVNLGQYKDINEAVNNAERITKEWIDERSTPYPLVGVFNADNFWDDLLNIRKYGFPKGWKPRLPFGNNVTIHPGYQTIVTGIPSHGKSEFLDQILLELCVDYDLRGAYFSPENKPTSLHLIKITEKLLGRSFWDCTVEEINSIKGWVADHIYWVYPDDGFNLSNVLEHVRKSVLRHGINWYVIDPWNKLDHQYQGQETAYISRCLDELDNFNKKNNVHGFIIAHPTKMEKDKDGNYVVPNLYSISGSAHFFNKTDIGWTVYKKAQGMTDVHVQKVKFKYWGEVGLINYVWDSKNGRYYTTNPDYTNWLKPKQKELIDFTQPINGTDDIPF